MNIELGITNNNFTDFTCLPAGRQFTTCPTTSFRRVYNQSSM